MESPPVVMITGGAAGIGFACARRFASEGWRVALFDRDADTLATAVSKLEDAGAETVAVEGDAGTESDLKRCADAAIESWGRIDTLVANAGVRVSGSILEATEQDWDTILSVNLKGVAYACKAVIPVMRRQESGAIVFVSSLNAIVPRPGMPIYDAGKAALLSLMGSLAVTHGGDGIRVNTICPGWTITDFHIRNAEAQGKTEADLWEQTRGHGLLGRPANPEEIASGIYFFGSDESAHTTAQTLCIDGGQGIA